MFRYGEKIRRYYYCSYDCELANDYYRTLLVGIAFPFGSILLFVGTLLLPIVNEAFGQGIFIILFFGQFFGWPMLWCAFDTRRLRRTIPHNSRVGRLVGDLSE